MQKCECSKSKSSIEEVETEKTHTPEEGAVCADDCQKACCLGCKATVGDAVCLADHSCCAAHNDDEVYDTVDEDAEENSHEGHNHESHEGHDHE